MKGIFISYRRDDTASEARLLYNYLRREFGDGLVFMDVEALREPGADFIDAIHGSLNNCDAVLAVMGRRWAGFDADTGSSRLDAPGDFIRMEIAMALQRRVRVIPVLVDGASMPPAETLPEDLRSLTRLQAVTLSHDEWEYSIGKLGDGLQKILGYKRRGGASGTGDGGSRRRWPLVAGGAVLGVMALVGAGLMFSGQSDNGQAGLPAGTRLATAPVQTSLDAVAITTNEPRDEAVDAQPPPITVSTVTSTAPNPPVDSTADRAMVARAQQLLSLLGYQPGPPDGVLGPATTQALQSFQQAAGAGGVRGEVSETLVAALERAVAGTHTTGAANAAPVRNLSGVWYSEEGVGFTVAHAGNGMAWYLNGQLVGEGAIAGDDIEMIYNIGGAVMGHIVARLDADGRHIRGTDSSSDGTVQSIVFHYGHLAQ